MKNQNEFIDKDLLAVSRVKEKKVFDTMYFFKNSDKKYEKLMIVLIRR